MSLPTTKSLEGAVIEILKSRPEGLTANEILESILIYFALPESAKYEIGNNSRPELAYRLGWAKTHAKNRGSIYRSDKGIWKINQ
jgi:restriction endonuclease Mrr